MSALLLFVSLVFTYSLNSFAHSDEPQAADTLNVDASAKLNSAEIYRLPRIEIEHPEPEDFNTPPGQQSKVDLDEKESEPSSNNNQDLKLNDKDTAEKKLNGDTKESTEDFSQKIKDALNRSKKIASKAADFTGSKTWQERYLSLLKQLGRSTIHQPAANHDFNYCIENPTTLAFTYVGKSDVYICRRMRIEAAWQEKELAQTLIHEAAHGIGYKSECDTTRVEVSAMLVSRENVAFANGYWETCEIDKEINSNKSEKVVVAIQDQKAAARN